MVSVLLLTTEEVLQRNGFWYRLDTIWIAEELEPFEDIKPEHVYAKPLSRDFYYAKHPDIPRSESEDENSITVNGFRNKHTNWKTKICIRRFEEKRRNGSRPSLRDKSLNSNNSGVVKDVTIQNFSKPQQKNMVKVNKDKSDDQKIRDFFNRLLSNVPPPPLANLQDSLCDNGIGCSLIVPPNEECCDFDLPDYSDFELNKLCQVKTNNSLVPATSTLKKKKKKVSFSLSSIKQNSEIIDSWNESIYGVSDLIDSFRDENIDSKDFVEYINPSGQVLYDDYETLWSDIVNTCGIKEIDLKSENVQKDEFVTRSHCDDGVIFDISNDDETGYAQFAIYKIHQTIKIETGMIDSSPLKDLKEDLELNNIQVDKFHFKDIYRLTTDDSACESPPENELQKNSDRVLSEHELRVQRSLQKLNVPEWYKNAPAPREGFLLRKRLSDASASATRWTGLNSKTTSLGSLGAAAVPPQPQLSPHTTSFGRWSTSRLNSNQTSPCSSTRSSIRGTSPLCSPSTRSSFSARQPYLGWRSQERLNNTPRTPHERLASSLLQQSASSKASEEIQTSIKEVTSAIVHYVSGLEPANGDIDRQPSPRSSQKLYWLESSFVGTKPLDSPQTPLSVTDALPPPHPRPPSSLRLEHRAAPDWQDSHRSLNLGVTRPSPGSTTLEDVLDSLLGLPSQTARVPTPQPSPRKSTSPYFLGGKSPRYEPLSSSTAGLSSGSLASRLVSSPSEGPSAGPSADHSPDTHRPGQDSVDNSAPAPEMRRSRSSSGETRRRSEPFAQHGGAGRAHAGAGPRRTSLDAAAPAASLERHDSRASLLSLQTENSTEDTFVKCKFPKCTARAPAADAKRHYKTCHNCTTTYCSKECRRAHWEKHRKVCLHSRASALCRQIISAAKEDPDSLHQISITGHKGYLGLGRGVVKVFFNSPEAAEKFTTHGFQYLSEPEFVKWTSLQPNEMGAELYTEVVKLCKSYNPETRVILFVAVCILSEVPTKGAVKWERQVVSRCAKLRLSKSVTSVIQEQNRRRNRRDSKSTPDDRETLILTSKLQIAGEKNAATAHKFREICFRNIVNELENRGVILKKHFPEVYSRLGAYVDGTSERFIPMTIYPKDVKTGKSFMCIIMPDSDLDSVSPLDGKVMTQDVGIDRSRHQLSTPM